jgi:DNA modification methylase
VEAYVERLVAVGRELLRVVKPRGSVWLILGDTCRRKEWLGIPWRVAFAMGDVGWRLRNEVIWSKPTHPAAAAKDQLGSAHEQMFHFVRGLDAYYDMDAIRDPPESPRTTSSRGRAPSDVWLVPLERTEFRDFAVLPEALVERPILATCPRGGIVLDPFLGSGTSAAVALRLGRSAVGIDFSSVSLQFSKGRIRHLLQRTSTRKGSIRRSAGNR